MNDILGSLLGSRSNSGPVGQIAKKLGIPPELANVAMAAVAPALISGLQKNLSKPGGLDSLLGALKTGGHQKYVDAPDTLGSDDNIADGNAILGHILGSKDVSRNVAGNAAQQTGIDADTLKKMLPMAGSVLMGALSKQTAGGQQVPQSAGAGGAADPMDMIGQLFGGGDSKGDQPDMDDVLNLAKKFF